MKLLKQSEVLVIDLISITSKVAVRIFLILFFVSCTVVESKRKSSEIQKENTSFFFESKDVSLECHSGERGDHCEKWQRWLEELIKKSPKHRITKAYYKEADAKSIKAKNFGELLKQLDGVVVSYADYHCLDGQISCTFSGEKKIYFNKFALSLNKVDWMRVFWHEVFHLHYPHIHHVSCHDCSGKKTRTYQECDKNSFSSYGLERFWVAAHAKKFSSDKKFNQQNEVMLKELNNRICR